MSPARDCHDLARRIADGLRLMADILEDPTDMNDATERVEQRPSEAPIEPLAAAEPEPRAGPPAAPVAAPAERRSPRQLLLKRTAAQFALCASPSAGEFETAFNNGV